MIKSGTVIGSVSGKTSNGNKIKSGTVIGTATKKVNEGPFVLPGIPVADQLHLTDEQKREAAVSRGYQSPAEEKAYSKSNPNLYAATGGKKYSEEGKKDGWAALRYPDAAITPDNLTEKGKNVIKAAKNADAGKTKYDNYTPEQIDKTISAKWHRSTNDEQTKKEVDYLKALKSVKEIGFNNLYEYNKAKNSPEILSEYKSKMDAAYKEYKSSKAFIGSKFVDRYIGGAENTESIEETQKREAWENAAAKYYALVYGSKQALEARYELLKTATAPMTTAWQKQAALKQLGIKEETAIREEKEIGAALKKTRTFDNYSEYIDANIKAGGVNLLTGVSATGEFFVGTPIKFMIDISGGDSSVISGKAARDALTKEYSRRAMEAAQVVGDDKNIGGQLIQNIVQNIPNIALAIYSAGTSTAVTLAEKAASLSGQAGKMARIGIAIKALSQNPMFWSSFSITAGNDYEEAINNGATPATATLYALMASGLNAYIEIGGGIETLPKDLVGIKNGRAMLKEFISTSLEEGGEEILQGAVSKLFSRLMYDRSPVSLESASDFAKQSLYEGAMGALGGAVMGGGQMTFSTIMNAKTVKQYKTIGEAAISAGQADSIIKYALGSDMYSELAQSALNTNNAQAVGEIYSYICRDVDAAINSAKSIDEAVEAIKAIARQEGLNNDTYTVTKGIAMPQFIEKVNEFGIDENTAGNVLDVILDVDKTQNGQTNAEMTEPTGAENAAGKVVENGASGSESEENIFTEPDKKEIFENKISGKMLTVTQQHIEETAKRLNPDIKIKWEPDLKTNGQWNPRTKVLSLNSNLSTAEAYVEIFKHEFLHSLESKADYNAFLKYLENDSIAFAQYAKSVLTQYGIEHTGGNAGAVQALFDLYYEMYTADTRIRPIDRQNFTIEDAKREAAADFFADVLFKGKEYRGEIANALKYGDELPSGNAETSLSALEELAQKDKNLFVRIMDAVKRFISNLKNHATNNSVVRDLEKLERKLQDVYNSEETKRPTKDGGVKWSIKNIFDDKGNSYGIGVFLDSELLSNLSERERIKKVKEYVRAIGGKSFTAFDKNGNQIQIRIAKSNEKFKNKSGKVVPVNKDLTTKYNKNIVKQESVVLVDELIATARQENAEPSKYPHGWLDNNGNNDWDKWTTFIQDKNKSVWQATLHIANTNSGEKILYDISTIIKVERSGKSDTNSTAISISENSQKSQENFNDNFSDNEKSSLKGDRLEELRYNPTMFAKRLINHFKLNGVNADELAGKLRTLVVKHNKGGNDWNYNSEGEMVKVPVIDSLIEELSEELAEYIKPQIYPEAQEVLKSIRNTTVYMDHIQRKEVISQYGSMTNFRKSTKLKESPNANVSLDSMWQEWAAAYPEWFDKDINPVDMPEEFNRIVNGLENSVEEFDKGDAAEYIAKEIKDILDNTGTRARNREKVEYGKNILDDYRKKESERLNKRNTQKRTREAQERVVKKLKYFSRMITKPTKKNYLPSGMYEVAGNCIKGLEKTVNSDNVVYTSAYADRLLSLKEQIEYPGNMTETEIAELKAEFSDMYNKALDENRFDRGADLEALSQKISLEEDEEEREELKARYDRIYYGDKDFGINFNKVANAIPKTENGDFGDFETAELKKTFNDLSDRLSGKTPREYSEHDWNAIDNAFSELENTIKNYNKLIGEEKAREVSECGQKMFGEIQRTIKKPHLFEWFSGMLKDPYDFFRGLGNFEKDSEWLRCYNTLNEGQKDTINYVRKAIGRFNKLSEDPRTKEMFDTKNLVECGLVDKTGERILVPKEFRLKLAMDSLDQDAYNHLIHSGITLPKRFKNYYKQGLLDKKIFRRQCYVANEKDWQKSIFDSLSPIEKEWYSAIKDYYEFSGKEIDKMFFQLNGYHLKLHEFYSHIIVDNSFLATPFGKMYEKGLPNVLKPGFTQERVGDIKALYGVGALSQLVNDIESHSQYIGMAIPIYNFNKLYNYSDGFETMQHILNDKFSGEATNYIEDMISDLIGNSRTTGNKLLRPAEKAFGKIKGNYAQAVLTLNPRVSLTQTASFPMALITLDSKSLARALLYIEDSKGKKHFGFARAERDIIDEVTALVWYRTQGYKVDDIQDVIAHKGKNVSGKLMDAVPGLFKWVNAFDEATVNRLFYATKFYVEDNFDFVKGSDEYYAKVKEIFEKTIELTQPNYTTLQRSPFMRSGSKNAIMGALSMFKTVPTMQISRLISAGEEIVTKLSQDRFTKQEKTEACKRFAKTYGAVMVSNAQLVILRMVVDALLNGFKRYRDKDEEITAKSIITGVLKDFIETPLGMLPLLGDFASAWVEKKFTGKWGFGSPTMPQLETITSLWDDAKGIYDKVTDDEAGPEERIKAVITGLEDLGTFGGYPIKNTKNIIFGVYYTVDDICNKIKNDRNFFESAVKDNFVNRVFGSHVKTDTQDYRTLVEAVINDDKEKYEYTLKRLLEKGYSDKNLFTGLRTALKNSDTVKVEGDKIVSKVRDKKVYKNLSEASKDTIESETRRIIAEEKMLSVKQNRSKDFKKLYEFSRLRDKSSYNRLLEDLKKDGFTENEIEIGLEVEKFKLLKAEGISIAEWFTAKRALSEQNARKNAEKYAAIQKMDFSAEEKAALWNYNK